MLDVDGRIMVFAGAGASKAICPDKFATTKEFFDDLLPPITGDQLFGFAINYLNSVTKTEVIDIEQVLWALQTLYVFYDNITNPKEISGFSFQQNLIEKLYRNHNVGHFLSVAPNIRASLADLIGRINQVVYDLYSYEPSERELHDNWIELISQLDGRGTRLDIFTTNYDVAIEAALNAIGGETTARKWRGIEGNVRQTIDLKNWIEASINHNGLLTKLHGSLDWKISGEKIYVGDPVFTGDHSKQAIIYPGFKGESSQSFFQVFHEYFAQSLSDSKVMIFVGFAFRDDHINRLIRENTRRETKIFVINPDTTIKFPSGRAKAKHIAMGFDLKSIGKVVESI